MPIVILVGKGVIALRYYLLLLIFILLVSGITVLALEPIQTDSTIVTNRIIGFNQMIPPSHPRLQLQAPELPGFRNFVSTLKSQSQYPEVYKYLNNIPLGLALPDEPPVPIGDEAQRKEIWLQGYQMSFRAANQAQLYAFTYLITNEPQYGREAARWLVHLSKWNLNGGINIKANDEAFIQSLRPMIFAYDWSYAALTESERQVIKAALGQRLAILFSRISTKFSLLKPTPPDNSLSHPMRFISTLGLGGLVLYQDLPEAPQYLAWAYEYYLRQFPVWGGADGGWSEGLEYWGSAMNQHFLFLDAMQNLGQTSLLSKPFFRNTGYFALYNLQPYPSSSFSDLCNITKPTPNNALIIEKLALIYHDPYLLSYSQRIFSKYPTGFNYYQFSCYDTLIHLFHKSQRTTPPAALSDLPSSRHFADIGWVALHSSLGNRSDDIMLGFKSSPFGSASHSFADQNSFVLNAFGEPLAISSGYREWYDSPHHLGWTRTTAAKNAILFNNEGQKIKSAEATGKILRFYTNPTSDLVSGDATQAYLDLNNQPLVKLALRHILFIERRYFFILDELETSEATSHQWLLHAKQQFGLASDGSVTIHQNHANLRINFLTPRVSELKFHQTNEFAVAVQPKFRTKMPEEWHFSANAFKPAKQRQFLTLLYPYQSDQTLLPTAKLINTSQGFLVIVTDASSSQEIFFAKETKRLVRAKASIMHGLAAIISRQDANWHNFALFDGTLLQATNFTLIASKPLTLEGNLSGQELSLNLQITVPTELRLLMPFAPHQINGLNKNDWRYDPASRVLTLNVDQSGKFVVR